MSLGICTLIVVLFLVVCTAACSFIDSQGSCGVKIDRAIIVLVFCVSTAFVSSVSGAKYKEKQIINGAIESGRGSIVLIDGKAEFRWIDHEN